jgi:hypothetical protein
MWLSGKMAARENKQNQKIPGSLPRQPFKTFFEFFFKFWTHHGQVG